MSEADESPLRFGNYWLDAELAKGGMSRLVRARLRGPGGFEKKLVVKQILPQLAQDPAFIELFVREANTLVQMSHPNIVPVYELGVIDGVYFLSMELVEGATIAELLRDGPLPEALCAHVGAQICEALRYAHERFGLVHRDVTPRNVIVDADGHVRLLDFGIAAPPALTGRGELFGSPGYMSPEQLRGLPLSGQSDLFSLGTVLYEAVTGQRALPERAEGKRDSLPPRLGEADGPRGELIALLNAMLARDPALRPASAAEAGARFRTWLAQQHPEGVAKAIGQRAERARACSDEAEGETRPAPIATERSATPGVTRTIATNRSFVALMATGTERIERAAGQSPVAHGAAGDAAAPARGPWMRRVLLGGLSAAALAGLLYSAGREQRSDAQAALRPRLRDDTSAPRAPATSPASAAAETLVLSARTAPDPAAGAAQPAAEPPPAAPSSAGDKPAAQVATATNPSNAPASARAHLSINALPWADVSIDGRALGPTPKRGLALTPGAHTLELACPPLGRTARVPLKLVAGTEQHVLVDLHADPPRVSLR